MAKIKDEQLIIPPHSTVAVLAPPSCGKGRFCRGLSKLTKVLHVETGKLLRQTEDPEIMQIMATGQNVDSERVVKLVKNHISTEYDHHLHLFLMLDSFPRELDQPEMLAGLAVGRIHILHLKVHDDTVRRRFKNSLEEDSDRKNRPDNSMKAFERRLREYRQLEPRILAAVSKMGFPVFKREISNTDLAVKEFHRIHITGHRNRRPEGVHLHGGQQAT